MKITHQRNSIRDGDFVIDFSRLIANKPVWVNGETLVGRAQMLISISKAFDFQPTSSSRPLLLSLPTVAKSLSIAEMAKMIGRIGNLPCSHAESRPAHPSQWRDLSSEVRLAFYHFATRASGPSYKFDLNLNPSIENGAYFQGVFAREFLHRRIARGLKEKLGGKTEFWFVLEEDEKHRLHIHGGLSVSENQRKSAREALRWAGGVWEAKGKQFQLHMPPEALNPDLRGSCYAGKRLQWSSASRRRLMKRLGGSREIPLFQGKALSVTRQIRRDAELIYDQARRLVIDYRKSELPRANRL